MDASDPRMADARYCRKKLRKKPGQFCGKWNLTGRDGCDLHGGTSLVGAASPTYKHGRDSVFALALPEKLRGKYQALLDDPRTAELTREKAVADLLLTQQMGRIGTGAEAAVVGGALLDAQELFAAMQEAYEAGDGPHFRGLLGKLGTALATGATAERDRQAAVQAEAETRKTLDLSRRLVDTETKIALRAQAALSAEELQTILVRLSDMVQEVVHAFVGIMKRLGIEQAVAEAEGRKVHSGFLVKVHQMAPIAGPGEVAN